MLLLALAPAALSAPLPSLSLDAALNAAMAGNPELSAMARAQGIAEGERRQAGSRPNPRLSWEAEDTRADSRTTTISLTQPIELGGKRDARIALAERGQALASAELELRRNGLRSEVLDAFQASLRAQERLRLVDESVALALRGLQIAQGRVGAGKAAPLEATRAQVQLADVKLELDRAEVERNGAYQRLATLMGVPEPNFSQVRADTAAWPTPPPSAVLLQRLGETADMRMAMLQVEQRDAALALAKTQRIPDLDVTLGSQYDRSARERVNVVGLSLPLPLFDRNQGRILAESRRVDQARDLRVAAELRARRETLLALDLWGSAQREAQSLRETILPAARLAVESATRGFEMGKFGFLEVLDAQRTLILARNQYLQALAQLSDARSRTERIFGDLADLR
ncbi:TolC family protein [Pseudomonas panipatensis]|nr:TolC family protein [Pseudomonas panipatensis]